MAETPTNISSPLVHKTFFGYEDLDYTPTNDYVTRMTIDVRGFDSAIFIVDNEHASNGLSMKIQACYVDFSDIDSVAAGDWTDEREETAVVSGTGKIKTAFSPKDEGITGLRIQIESTVDATHGTANIEFRGY